MNGRRKVLSVVALIGAAIFALPSIGRSQPAPPPTPYSFVMSTTNTTSPWFPLSNGLGTCSVVVDNVPSGLTIIPQVTSDTLPNQNPAVVTASNVGSGAIIAAGTSVGNVSATGLTGFRLVSNGTYTGTATMRYFCSNASSSGGSSSGGGTVQVSPLPLPVVPTGGPYAISVASPIPIVGSVTASGNLNSIPTNILGSGSISAAGTGNAFVIPTLGYSAMGVTLGGTFVGTYTWACDYNGATYPNVPFVQTAGGTVLTSYNTTGSFTMNFGLCSSVEIYFSSYTSGTATISYNLGAAQSINTFKPNGDAVNQGILTLPITTFGYAYTGTSWNRIAKFGFPNGPLYTNPGGTNAPTTVTYGNSGPVVVKSTSGILTQAIIVVSGTGNLTFYDNASACSGEVIAIIPGTTADSTAVAGHSPYVFNSFAANGITACGTSTSPNVTLWYD